MGRTSPHAVAGLGPAVAIAANQWATFALLENGTVWAWGYNTYGTLGDGTGTSRSTPVQVVGPSDVVAIAQGYLSGLALTSSGTVWGWGMWLSGSTPAVITGLPTVAAIAAGDRCFFGLEPDGTVWGWKNNSLGQLANGTTNTAAVPPKPPRSVPSPPWRFSTTPWGPSSRTGASGYGARTMLASWATGGPWRNRPSGPWQARGRSPP